MARGRTSGQGQTLTAMQEDVIHGAICDQQPEQLKTEFAPCNRTAVMQLIERGFGVRLAAHTVENCLKRWDCTPQKPIKRAHEKKPEAVKAWLAERKDALEAFYLPSYSPALNPDERLNADLKYAIGSNGAGAGKGKVTRRCQRTHAVHTA